MKKNILIIIFLIANIFELKVSFAQQNVMQTMQMQNQFIFPKINTDPFRCIYKYNNNSLYIMKFCADHPIENNQNIEIFEINNKIRRKLYFTMLNKDWINNFSVYNNKIAIEGQNYIYYCTIEKDGKCNLIIKLDNYKSCNEIKLTQNRIALYRCCFSCTDPGTSIVVYDLKTNKLLLKKEMPNPKGFQMTIFQPRRLISYHNNFFAISDLTEYKIRIYDVNLNKVTEFSRKPDKWSYYPDLDNKLSKINNSDQIWGNIKHYEEIDNKASSIRFVDFIDESTILICWSYFDNEKQNTTYIYDIWKNKNKSWVLIKQDLPNSIQQDIRKEKFNYDKIASLFTNYSVDNNKIIIPDRFPILLNTLDLKNITFDDIDKKEKEYYKKNDITGSVFIYNLKK